jgi:hypothetical protein
MHAFFVRSVGDIDDVINVCLASKAVGGVLKHSGQVKILLEKADAKTKSLKDITYLRNYMKGVDYELKIINYLDVKDQYVESNMEIYVGEFMDGDWEALGEEGVENMAAGFAAEYASNHPPPLLPAEDHVECIRVYLPYDNTDSSAFLRHAVGEDTEDIAITEEAFCIEAERGIRLAVAFGLQCMPF